MRLIEIKDYDDEETDGFDPTWVNVAHIMRIRHIGKYFDVTFIDGGCIWLDEDDFNKVKKAMDA
jgi:hypothetical protein